VPPSTSQAVSLWRRLTDWGATGFAILAAILVLAPLLAIFVYLVIKGVGSVNWAFLTQTPKPPGETGSGIYLAEYGRNRFGDVIRFTADVLNGVPSIVVGITVYSLIVIRQKHFSAFSGGVALGIMMIPTVTRTTEEMLLMVPHAVREAALALGVPNWRSVLSITVKTASPGIITGCMLAFARVAGETAPLIFTAFGNVTWSARLNEPIAALPLQIYIYATSPYDDWHRLAWAGALVLIVLIVLAVSLVRYVTSRGVLKGAS
jgi:phosphate transport system permease protein